MLSLDSRWCPQAPGAVVPGSTEARGGTDAGLDTSLSKRGGGGRGTDDLNLGLPLLIPHCVTLGQLHLLSEPQLPVFK